MDEINQDLCGINRSKRKFQDQILELPIAKHTCLEKIFTPSKFQSEKNNENVVLQISKDFLDSQELAIVSNSASEDADSVTSLISDHDSRVKQRICQYDAPHSSSSPSSSSSVNWSGTGKPLDVSETKTSDEIHSCMCPSFEMDCEFSSPGLETKQTEDEEASMEDLFCPDGNGNGNENGFISNNYILSSGRWNVNQDTEQGAEKLTIDKEFEQYFSMLML